ncbi:hypothetical protein, partial [Pseudomonas sp. PS01300]|uniref:hypothetical protein n=1 Tax=Pseudomonas sp. PS01300 TaxID=2991436 RepID=UPI00249BBE43
GQARSHRIRTVRMGAGLTRDARRSLANRFAAAAAGIPQPPAAPLATHPETPDKSHVNQQLANMAQTLL